MAPSRTTPSMLKGVPALIVLELVRFACLCSPLSFLRSRYGCPRSDRGRIGRPRIDRGHAVIIARAGQARRQGQAVQKLVAPKRRACSSVVHHVEIRVLDLM